MKKFLTMLLFCAVLFSATFSLTAAEGKVTYSGNSGNFVFEPGSEASPSDLFADFKGVMPGDTLTQKITVRNNADDEIKVKIYLRALGAQEGSAEFLSQLGLKVKTSDENEMAYMFDATADQTAQLTDWVCLGTLFSGGEVNLDVMLTVPVELDNRFQDSIGYLDWEFKVEEFPVASDDPIPPTSDNTGIGMWIAVMAGSVALIAVLLILRKKRRNDESDDKEE